MAKQNAKDKATPLTEEQLLSKEAELNAKETELNERETALAEKETALIETEKTLNSKETELADREIALSEREKALPAEEVEEAPEPGLEFNFEDGKYKFHDSAPKSILFNGKAYTQKQLAKDEDILLQLVGGKSGLIQKL